MAKSDAESADAPEVSVTDTEDSRAKKRARFAMGAPAASSVSI